MIKSCKLLTVNYCVSIIHYLSFRNSSSRSSSTALSNASKSCMKKIRIDHTHQIIYNHFSLGSRPKTNPSADHFQYRPRRYTGTNIRTGWGTSMDETTIILTQQNLQQATAKERAP